MLKKCILVVKTNGFNMKTPKIVGLLKGLISESYIMSDIESEDVPFDGFQSDFSSGSGELCRPMPDFDDLETSDVEVGNLPYDSSDEESVSLGNIIPLLISFYQSPEIRKDLISKWTFSSHCLLAISTGYFIYDMVDMLLNDPKSKTFELIVHHMLVISCFTLCITTYNYEGYGIMALLVEVNSVFLHIRQLMIIQTWNRKTLPYRLNSSLNLGTFVVFRILTMGWMTRWLIQHRYDLTPFAFNLAGISLAVIMVMNIVLLLRVLKSDYQQRPTQHNPDLPVLHTKAS